MQDRPSAIELLEAVAEFLERDVMPVEGRVGFHARVARNVVEIVRREIELGGPADAAEYERLRTLLVEAPDDLRDANVELARRIRSGELDADEPALVDHLRRTAIDRLRIANPREIAEGPRDQPA